MTSGRRRSVFGIPRVVWAILIGAFVIFVIANIHLAYVAFGSQPECVPHLKEKAADDGKFRAAKSAC